MQPTSEARAADAHRASASESGVVLLDIVLALAVFALVALVAWPVIPRGTSAARHAGYALQVAALLKADRTVAAREGREVSTQVDIRGRVIASGGGGARAVRLPRDLLLDVLASDVCVSQPGAVSIAFAPDGRACGAVLRIAKGDRDWKVRVNWLTGHVDVLAPGQS